DHVDAVLGVHVVAAPPGGAGDGEALPVGEQLVPGGQVVDEGGRLRDVLPAGRTGRRLLHGAGRRGLGRRGRARRDRGPVVRAVVGASPVPHDQGGHQPHGHPEGGGP